MMEQDAAYFDVHRTGALMSVLSTNVRAIQGVLVSQAADLCEGVAVSVLLLSYMLTQVGCSLPGCSAWHANHSHETLVRCGWPRITLR